MQRVFAIQLLIIIIALVFIVPLALSVNNSSVAKYHQAINSDNAWRFVTFSLKSGQEVTGSLTFYNNQLNGNWFAIYDPKGNAMVTSPTDYSYEQNNGTFKFTATVDGTYTLGIDYTELYARYIDYSYNISSPTVLGLDPVVLIIFIVLVAAILTVANVFFASPRHKIALPISSSGSIFSLHNLIAVSIISTVINIYVNF